MKIIVRGILQLLKYWTIRQRNNRPSNPEYYIIDWLILSSPPPGWLLSAPTLVRMEEFLAEFSKCLSSSSGIWIDGCLHTIPEEDEERNTVNILLKKFRHSGIWIPGFGFTVSVNLNMNFDYELFLFQKELPCQKMAILTLDHLSFFCCTGIYDDMPVHQSFAMEET